MFNHFGFILIDYWFHLQNKIRKLTDIGSHNSLITNQQLMIGNKHKNGMWIFTFVKKFNKMLVMKYVIFHA